MNFDNWDLSLVYHWGCSNGQTNVLISSEIFGNSKKFPQAVSAGLRLFLFGYIYSSLVYLPSTMKVVLVLLVFLTLSDEIYLKHHKLYKHHKYNRLLKPGIKNSWDYSLIGLDFLAFQNNHLSLESKVWISIELG